jgi:predicted dehydrogenase
MIDLKQKNRRVAIIGGGINSAVGNVHRTALRIVGNNSVVGGYFSKSLDKNVESQIWWGAENRKPFLSLSDCIDSSDLFDTVIILTPPSQHAEAISKFLKIGKTVITEKPTTGKLAEIDSLIKNFKKETKHLRTTYNYSGYPMIRELKKIIEDNRFGRIINVKIEMYQEGFLKVDEKGNPITPQNWRLEDGEIPTVSLDLGTHVLHLLYFLTGDLTLKGHSTISSSGFFKVTDQVDFVGNDLSGKGIRLGWGKVSLGNQNGLRVEIFGERGAATWVQSNPEELRIANSRGEITLLARGNPSCLIANETRYTRFKGGHPSGFLEAFANLYEDLLFMKIGETFVESNYGIDISQRIMFTLFNLHKFSLSET